MKKAKNNIEDTNKIVSEDFGDFLKEDLYSKSSEPENFDENIDTSDMPDLEEDEVSMEDKKDKFYKILQNELLIPEYSRESFSFKLKNYSEIIIGTPMAEFPSRDSFVIKINGKNQKIKLSDILDIEQVNESVNEEMFYNEYSFTDYIFEISNYIKTEVTDWDILIEEEYDLINWLEKNQDLWDLQNLFAAGVSAEDAAIQIIHEIQAVEEEE